MTVRINSLLSGWKWLLPQMLHVGQAMVGTLKVSRRYTIGLKKIK